MAAEARTYLRIRGVIEEAVAPGGVLFRQGDRSSAFYLVESGEVEMSLVPDEAEEGAAAIPVRRYGPGECFGASGVLPGDERRRNTATALSQATLKVIPHKHFQVLMKDNHFLKAGLHAKHVLSKKQEQKVTAGRGLDEDEEKDEIVLKQRRK